MKKLGWLAVLIPIEAAWHLGKVSARLKRILGITALCIAFGAFCSTAGAAIVLERPYGPKELTFQLIQSAPERHVFVHYDYVERLSSTLYELRCQQKEVTTKLFYGYIELVPEGIIPWFGPPTERNLIRTPCFSGPGELYR